MEWWLLGIICFVGLIIILATGMPVAFSLGFLSMIVMYFLWGFDGLMTIANTAYTTNSSFFIICVPLFILMGEAVAISGIARDAFKMIDAWMGWLPGGIAVSTVGTCTIFGAVTGFAPATVAALAPLAVPEMVARGYNRAFALGAIATGAGIAIIIPPSILMVLYGILAEASIGQLFYGGVVPGLVLSGVIMSSIVIRATISRSLAPYRKGYSWSERIKVSVYILPFVVLILLVLGSIWGGAATPTEASALGTLGAFGLMIMYNRMNWQTLKQIILSSTRVTCMLMFIVIGATLFTQLLAYIGFTEKLALYVTSLPLSRWMIIGFMMLLVFALGCVMDAGSILFITIPLFIPIVDSIGFDKIWFGILILLNLEIATITPPVGLNLYVLKGVLGDDVTMEEVIRGSAPYWAIDFTALIIIATFPGLVTWLPNIMILNR